MASSLSSRNFALARNYYLVGYYVWFENLAETITVAYASDDDEGDPKEHMTRYNVDNSWRDEVWDFADNILLDKPVVTGSSTEALKTISLVYRIYCADPPRRAKYDLSCAIPEGVL